MTLNVGQPISHRLDHILSGIQAQVAIKVFGPDLERLRGDRSAVETAIRARARGGRRRGRAADARSRRSRSGSIGRRRRARGSRSARPTNCSKPRSTAGSSRRQSTRASGSTWWCASTKNSAAISRTLQGLLVDAPDGRKVPLSTIAAVTNATGPNQILRENALRRIVVQCNTAGRDLGSVVADIQRVVGGSVSSSPATSSSMADSFRASSRRHD